MTPLISCRTRKTALRTTAAVRMTSAAMPKLAADVVATADAGQRQRHDQDRDHHQRDRELRDVELGRGDRQQEPDDDQRDRRRPARDTGRRPLAGDPRMARERRRSTSGRQCRASASPACRACAVAAAGPGYHRAMDFGLCLPNFRDGSSAEGLDAAAEVAERFGWSTVWTTDHVVVAHATEAEYGRVYEAILTLAWLGRPASPRPPRHERDRRSAAERGPARQGAVHARLVERRAGHGRDRCRLEHGRVREPGDERPFPRARRVPRRDDPAVAPPVVGRDRAVPRPVPYPRGLHVRAATGPGRPADPDRRHRRACPSAGRASRRRIPRQLDQPGASRRDDPDRDGGCHRGRPTRAVILGEGSCPVRAERPTTPSRCAARPRRWPPRCGPMQRSAWTTWPLSFAAVDPAGIVAEAERFQREVVPLV